MRHPENLPKYRINQKVHVPFCPKEGIVKGFRYCAEEEFYDNRAKFLAIGYEYHIFIASKHPNDLSEWGWLKETELSTIN